MFTYKTVTAITGSFVICAGATQLPGLISPASLKRLGKTTYLPRYIMTQVDVVACPRQLHL